jgi:hypothetical protein
MRGTWIRALGILLVISLCASAQQTVYQALTSMQGPNFYRNFSGNFLGTGARAEGMGRAFLGVSDDISAVAWNPAGLVGNEKPVMGLSLGSLRPRGSFGDAGLLNNPRGRDFVTKQTSSLSNLDFLGFLSPIRIRGHQFVFSGAYSRQFEDYSTVCTEFDGRVVFNVDGVNFTEFDYNLIGLIEQRATPYAVNIGFGTRFYKDLNVGLAVNVYTGKQFNRTNYLIRVPSFVAPDRIGGQVVEADQRLNLLDTFGFSGINFTLGAKVTSGKLSYGAVVKSGFDLNIKGGLTFSDSIFYNGQSQSDLSVTIYADNQLIKLSIPWVIASGIAYKATENLLLAADVEYRPYEGKMVNRRDSTRIRSGQDNEEFFTSIDPGWFNCFGIRTGMEYLWQSGSKMAPTVPLRCGMGYTGVPAPSYDRVGGTESSAQLSLSAGAGVYWSQIHLDVAYSYTSLNRNVLTPFFVSQFIPPALSYGELRTRNHNLSATFTGYF